MFLATFQIFHNMYQQLFETNTFTKMLHFFNSIYYNSINSNCIFIKRYQVCNLYEFILPPTSYVSVCLFSLFVRENKRLNTGSDSGTRGPCVDLRPEGWVLGALCPRWGEGGCDTCEAEKEAGAGTGQDLPLPRGDHGQCRARQGHYYCPRVPP